MDKNLPGNQRAALQQFAEALGSASTALRRDECGDPRINGRRGHIYACPGPLGSLKTPGFLLYCVCETGKAWTYAKRALNFAALTNDGDEEGILFLDRLPAAGEAETIRAYLGIPKKVELSEAALVTLRERVAGFNSGRALSH